MTGRQVAWSLLPVVPTLALLFRDVRVASEEPGNDSAGRVWPLARHLGALEGRGSLPSRRAPT